MRRASKRRDLQKDQHVAVKEIREGLGQSAVAVAVLKEQRVLAAQRSDEAAGQSEWLVPRLIFILCKPGVSHC